MQHKLIKQIQTTNQLSQIILLLIIAHFTSIQDVSQKGACPAILWTPIFGRNTRKIHVISYNFMGKHAFWMASFQCLA